MNICSLGYSYFPEKLKYQARSMARLGFNYHYLVLKTSKSDQNLTISTDGFRAIEVSCRPLRRIAETFTFFLKNKIDIVEIYDTGLLTTFYAVISFVLRKKIVFFLIGMELLPKERGSSKSNLKRIIKRIGLFLSLKISSRIIYKEHHMENYLKKWSVFEKCIHLGNAVPLYDFQEWKKDIDVAYVNSVRKMRHPLLFIKAIEVLNSNRKMPLKCVMAGFHSLSENENIPDIEAESEALRYIHEKKLEAQIQVLPFTEDALQILKRTKIFVLPSDVIYANYALLEAMSFGCVPVVTSGDGAEKIVENEVNGFICDFSEFDIALSIEKLLKNDPLVLKFSSNARRKVENNFNINNWSKKLADIYKKISN